MCNACALHRAAPNQGAKAVMLSSVRIGLKDEDARRDALQHILGQVLCLPDDAAIAAVALAEGLGPRSEL